MYKLQVVLVSPSARDAIVPINYRINSMESSQMIIPSQNGNQSSMQQNMEVPSQFPNMNNENISNFNTSNIAPLYQAPSNTKKFLHFTKPSNTLFSLSEEIQIKCEKIYPNLSEPIEILSIQDSSGCDLDPEFIVKDVFNMDNVVRVILQDELDMTEDSNISLYKNNKRRKLNEGASQYNSNHNFQTQPSTAQGQSQNQPNGILKIAKKRSAISNIKSSIGSNLRVSTPLANQIYPLHNPMKISNNSDDEDDIAERSFLPPPNQPQSPPIRISSGIDSYKRIKSAKEDTVSRSETVDPDKSKQQRMFSGTPIRTVMTPNRVTLTGQRVLSENLLTSTSSSHGLVFASSAARQGSRNLASVVTSRIASGSLSIPEPKITEVEKELREGPASPSSMLPAKGTKIPMKQPYIEKSLSPDSDSSSDNSSEQYELNVLPSLNVDKSSSKESPFNHIVANQINNDAVQRTTENNHNHRGISNTRVNGGNNIAKRKSSLEAKLQNKSFTNFSQNGQQEELRRMDHFSDEDEQEEDKSEEAKAASNMNNALTSKRDDILIDTIDENGDLNNNGADDTAQHIVLEEKSVKNFESTLPHESLQKNDLLNMVTNNASVETFQEKDFILHKPTEPKNSDLSPSKVNKPQKDDSTSIYIAQNTSKILKAEPVKEHVINAPTIPKTMENIQETVNRLLNKKAESNSIIPENPKKNSRPIKTSEHPTSGVSKNDLNIKVLRNDESDKSGSGSKLETSSEDSSSVVSDEEDNQNKSTRKITMKKIPDNVTVNSKTSNLELNIDKLSKDKYNSMSESIMTSRIANNTNSPVGKSESTLTNPIVANKVLVSTDFKLRGESRKKPILKEDSNSTNHGSNESDSSGTDSSQASSSDSSSDSESEGSNDEANRSVRIRKTATGEARPKPYKQKIKLNKDNVAIKTASISQAFSKTKPKQRVFQTPEFIDSDSESELEPKTEKNTDDTNLGAPKNNVPGKTTVDNKLETLEQSKSTIKEDVDKDINSVKQNVSKTETTASNEVTDDTPTPLDSNKPQPENKGSPSKSSSSDEDSSSDDSSDVSSSSSDDEVSMNSKKSRRLIVSQPKGKVNSRQPSINRVSELSSEESNSATLAQKEPPASIEKPNESVPSEEEQKTKSAANPSLGSNSKLPSKFRPSLSSLSDLVSRGIPEVKEKSIFMKLVSSSQPVGSKEASSDSESSSESNPDSDSDSDSDSGSDSDSDSNSNSSNSSASDEETNFISAKSASTALKKKKTKKMSGGFASLLKDSKKK